VATDWLEPRDYLPDWPERRDWAIGIVGAGFIVRDCHLEAYRSAGFHVDGITARNRNQAESVAELHQIPHVFDRVEELLDEVDVAILDLAVPPQVQPGIIARILQHPRKPRGILAHKPLAPSLNEAREIVDGCARAGILLQVNQNMRYDPSVRALRSLLNRGVLGDPVLATIEMRAIPHWMPWAEGGRSLSTFIMSIHHLDCFRYWLGEPDRVLASCRPDPRTRFAHEDGINLYILEFASGARASAWDDVWAGPALEGAAADHYVRWRVEGTRGMAMGTIGWPEWPRRAPSTLTMTSVEHGTHWYRPQWRANWFPDAFAGTMAGLMRAIETGQEPDISGRDNLGTIALCEAIWTAAREHRVVSFASQVVGPRGATWH
jgi:predicted dehydrogenase